MSAIPSRFGLIGAGWRAEYFVRLARLLPDQVEVVGVVARRPEVAQQVATRWAVPDYGSLAELTRSQRPDFVISSVTWAANPKVIEPAVELEVPRVV